MFRLADFRRLCKPSSNWTNVLDQKRHTGCLQSIFSEQQRNAVVIQAAVLHALKEDGRDERKFNLLFP